MVLSDKPQDSERSHSHIYSEKVEGRYSLLRLEHRPNAPYWMLVTRYGIMIDVNPEQPENAELPMLVTLSGIVIDVSPEQPPNV